MLSYFRAPLPWTEILKRTLKEISRDNCLGLAAQLAFYFLLALFPALIFFVALLGYLPVEGALESLLDALAAIAPAEVLAIMRRQMTQLTEGGSAGLLTLGVLGAIWSSSAAMMAIIHTLNRAFDIIDRRPWWKQRAIAIGLTLIVAVFVVSVQVLLLLGPVTMEFAKSWTGLPHLQQIWGIVRWPLVVLLIVLVVDVVYFVAPDADTEWVWLTPGSVVATALWIAASYGFEWYVRNMADFNATYGALGGFIVTMLWFYLSGLAILIGAELNAEIEREPPHRHEAAGSATGRPRLGPAAERGIRRSEPVEAERR